MNELSCEIFKTLTWPTERDLDQNEDSIPKRPSPYWVYEKLLANREKLSSDLKITKNATIECWHSMMNYIGLRLVMNASRFGYYRALILTKDHNYRSPSYSEENSFKKCVESIHSGIIIEEDHMFFGSIISFVYRNKSSLKKIRSIIEEQLSNSEILSIMEFSDNPVNSNFHSLKRCFSSDLRSIRTDHARILLELIDSPLEKLNEISMKLGLSRSTVNRNYSDLVRSGLITIEPYIRTENNREFILVSFQIEPLSGKVKSNSLDQIPNSWLKERIIARKFSVPNRILILTWLDNFDQIRMAIREIEKSNLKVNYAILQQKTTHSTKLNREIVLRSMGLPKKQDAFKRNYMPKEYPEQTVENFNMRI